MNFSFWPFLWFGLPGRLLIRARLKISSENEILERATHHGPIFLGGEIETSRLKISSEIKFSVEIENFDRERKLFWSRSTLWGPQMSRCARFESGSANEPNRANRIARFEKPKHLKNYSKDITANRMEFGVAIQIANRCDSIHCELCTADRLDGRNRAIQIEHR